MNQRRRIRLLCIGYELGQGGTERSSLTLLDALDKSRFDTTLLFLRDKGGMRHVLPEGFEPNFVVPHAGSVIRRPLRLLSSLLPRAINSDLIIGMQEASALYLATAAARIVGRPSIGWVRTAWSHTLEDLAPWHRYVWKPFFRSATRLIAISEGVAENLVSLAPGLKPAIRVLTNPFDFLAIRRQSMEPVLEQDAEIARSEYIVAVGRLVRQKAFDSLIRAFSLIADRRPACSLVIVGEGLDRPNLESQVRTLKLDRRVRLIGHRDNPYPLIKGAALLALSSRYEGLARVLVEAHALGVPVVSVDCPHGPREVLQGGKLGMLLPTEDPSSLGGGMLQMLESPQLQADFRKRGLNSLEKYDPVQIAPQAAAIFESCVNGRTHSGDSLPSTR